MRFTMIATAFFILLLFLDLGSVSCQFEKELLLELRNSLTYDSSASTKLVNWNESSNFCLWSGVNCDFKSRVSGLDLSGESISAGINGSSTLFELSHLQSLSLAENSFNSPELPPQFGQLTELRYLNLSNTGFSGQIPLSFSNLTRLVVLDLSNTMYSSSLTLENPNLGRLIHNYTRLRELYLDRVNISANMNELSKALSSSTPNLRVLSLFYAFLEGPLDSSLLKLKSLSVLRLDGNDFSSPFPSFLADFPNLEVLTLSSCSLSGVVPSKLFQIKSLQIIDLSGNYDVEGSLSEFPINGSLQKLMLSGTRFSGNLSESIGNLKMLSNVEVSNCSFSGPIPSTIKNLKNLVSLDLSLNQFSGSIPSFAFLKNLEELSFESNRLTGEIHDSFWKGLENLDLLDLRSNNLEGPIPRMFFELKSLSSLYLSGNKFNGSIELTDFQKLRQLSILDLSYNNIYVHVKEEVALSEMFPNLTSLMLASCNLKKLPNLRNYSSLVILDLSDNQLEGEIPNWLWRVGEDGSSLNISHNRFTHLQQPYNFSGIEFLFLNSNLLVGEIPTPPPSALIVDFSSNNFSSPLPPDIGNILSEAFFFSVADNNLNGTIPSSFCNATFLVALNLSNNTFSGRIPPCLLRKHLAWLNLRRNKLEGEIPDTLPTGCDLVTLDLSWNSLEGSVPKSLTRCTKLQILNLRNNRLNETFPCWLNALSKLRVLILCFNRFNGNISCLGRIDTWPDLQIINFASNNISGVIPANMFRFLHAFIADEERTQQDLNSLVNLIPFPFQGSVPITIKQVDFELQKILSSFTSVDFSDNHLHGPIPNSIGEAKSLYILNISRNSLSGHIPPSVGNMSKLETLDLSHNAFDGEIPVQLAEMTWIAFLDLSYNNLVGRIPRGNQLQTFPETRFIGNERLCGFPLKTCEEDRIPALQQGGEREEEDSEREEIYVSIALGFVVGLGLLFGPLLFCKRWRRCYIRIVGRSIAFVLPQQYHKQLNLKRKRPNRRQRSTPR